MLQLTVNMDYDEIKINLQCMRVVGLSLSSHSQHNIAWGNFEEFGTNILFLNNELSWILLVKGQGHCDLVNTTSQ